MPGKARPNGSIGGVSQAQPAPRPQDRHWLSTPEPIRRVFNHFPLKTYGENHLPQRSQTCRKKHILYIFTTSTDRTRTNLSCNPACLKWQTYLIIQNVDFEVKSSNNHASPSGSLPFLLPSQKLKEDQRSPIVASKIPKWISTPADTILKADMQQEAYFALIDQNIRNAWLYHLYLDAANFEGVVRPLYISSLSSSMFVHLANTYQLKNAAREELLKSRTIIDCNEVYQSADRAFRSLSALLQQNRFFSGQTEPGLFDASVFAYTHLLLSETLDWRTHTLQNILRKYSNLVQHSDQVLQFCLNR